jgi:protein-tyrosine phosphatase
VPAAVPPVPSVPASSVDHPSHPTIPAELLDVEIPHPAPRRLVPRWVLRVGAAFVLFLVAGNLAIFLAMVVAKAMAPDAPALPDDVTATISNAEAVDDHLWRGGAPDADGYRALADGGVTTVIDLRAEEDIEIDEGLLAAEGIERIHLPMRDGQAPTAEQVQRFLQEVAAADGRVFVNCGAGVGRTGTMVASYLVAEHGRSGWSAMRANLEVGPPSLEQLAFSAGLAQGEEVERPNPIITGISRVLDAPRRSWKVIEDQ